MRSSLRMAVATACLLPLSIGCTKTGQQEGAQTASSDDGGGGGGGLVGSLVNVDLRDVLNDLAARLNLDRSNIPINAQVPIQLAVNICGVSINILSVSTGGQANCSAKTSNQELAQVVQQQIAAGGSVGGGAQGGSGATTDGASAGSGSATSGSAGTTAGSGGSTAGTTGTGTAAETPPPQPQ
jgi:hypothetical protein